MRVYFSVLDIHTHCIIVIQPSFATYAFFQNTCKKHLIVCILSTLKPYSIILENKKWVLFSTLNQNGLLCRIWAANNYKNYCKCRVNVRKVVSFLLKHPLLKSYWFYKRHFLWRQFGFKYVPNQNGLHNEYKSFLKKNSCTCIFTNFESSNAFFFDMDKKKKSRENAGA